MSGPDVKYEEVDMDLVEQIVNMVEEDDVKKWEYQPSKSGSPEEDSLAQAQRFMAAQSFLLSWQTGKVPTGWRRARQFSDFKDESPLVIGAAKLVAKVRMEERNHDANARIQNFRQSSGKRSDASEARGVISQAEITGLKEAYSKFSSDLYDINTALSNVTSTIADITLRTQALSEQRLP